MRAADDGTLEIEFARVGVAANPTATVPVRSYFAPMRFAKFAGEPVRLVRDHNLHGATLGVGSIEATESAAVWRGRALDTQMGTDLLTEVRQLAEAGKPLEASIGFRYDPKKLRRGKQRTASEEAFTDVVFDEVESVDELSIVGRGAVPGTRITLNEFMAGLPADDQSRGIRARARSRLALRDTFGKDVT